MSGPVRTNFAHQDGAVQSDRALVRVAEPEQTGQGGGGVSASGGMYVKSHSSRLVSGYRTSGVVESQRLGRSSCLEKPTSRIDPEV